jgi:hypothetical protein
MEKDLQKKKQKIGKCDSFLEDCFERISFFFYILKKLEENRCQKKFKYSQLPI